LEKHGFERIEHGNLVNTYMRSTFEDTRRKALKYGAQGATVKAFKPQPPAPPAGRGGST
jgi:hypothetical protein